MIVKKEKLVTESNIEATSKVKRVDVKVWIESVPLLGWGKDRECTFAGALEAALAVTEHPCNYSDIMGLTGLGLSCSLVSGGHRKAMVSVKSGWGVPGGNSGHPKGHRLAVPG